MKPTFSLLFATFFNTLDGYQIGNVTIPEDFPSIWTGGFWACQESPCPSMIEELAMNDAAAALMRALEAKPQDPEAAEVRALLSSVAALERVLHADEEPTSSMVRAAKQLYDTRIDDWTKRMTPLDAR